jgi:hypothetical protein
MQMDGGMGSVVAVQDMLMHSRRGIVHVFPGAPRSWKFANFKDMPAGDGFMISATLENRKISGIKVKAVRRGKLKLANPVTGGRVKIILSNGRESISSDNVLKICLGAGEQCHVVCL